VLAPAALLLPLLPLLLPEPLPLLPLLLLAPEPLLVPPPLLLPPEVEDELPPEDDVKDMALPVACCSSRAVG
jgi:hypothetical protein